MKKTVISIVLSLCIFAIAPSHTSNKPSYNDIVNIFSLSMIENQISSYVGDVGVKYKYSSRAKNFLTKENINLILFNCDGYPSVIIAMAIIETGWGKYAIGNNYFGIKGKGHIRKTKEWNGYKYITITDSFQKYKSKADNIRAVSNLLHYNKRYNIGAASNYKEAAHLVKNGGYATDPLYAYKLKFIIEKYELYRLDEIKDNNKIYV